MDTATLATRETSTVLFQVHQAPTWLIFNRWTMKKVNKYTIDRKAPQFANREKNRSLSVSSRGSGVVSYKVQSQQVWANGLRAPASQSTGGS